MIDLQGASGNNFPWFRCVEKPSIYAGFGTRHFSSNRFATDEIVTFGLQLNLKIA